MALSNIGILNGIIPSLSVKLNALELALNFNKQLKRGKSEHIYFMIAIFDICIVKFSTINAAPLSYNTKGEGIESGRHVVSFLGISRHLMDNTEIVSYYLNLRLINSLIAVVFVILLYYVIPFSSSYVFSIMPIVHIPILEMTLTEWLISYRGFIALQQLLLSFTSAISAFNREHERSQSVLDYLLPFLHYRVLVFLMVSPAILLNYHPFIFVMTASAVISYLDALLTKQSIVFFSWLKCLKLELIGAKYHKEDPSEKPFQLMGLTIFCMGFLKDSSISKHIDSLDNKMNPELELKVYSNIP